MITTNWDISPRYDTLPDDHWAVHDERRQLQRDLETLERRLQDGERRIDEAARLGGDTDEWEAFWIELLHSYEAAYRRLDQSAEKEGGKE